MSKKRSQLFRKMEAKSQLNKSLRENTIKSDIVMDTIFENERAVILFTKATFSKKSLLPTDPASYCDVKGDFVVELKYFEPPSNWEWVSDWMVDMNGTVDDQGWSYNSSFLSKTTWKTNFEKVGSITIVRRRKWTRMRRLCGFSSPQTRIEHSRIQEILSLIQRQRNDCEKLKVLKEYLAKNTISDAIVYTTVLQELEHDTSILDGCMLIAGQENLSLDIVRLCVRLLVFGSDKIAFLKATNLDPSQYPLALG